MQGKLISKQEFHQKRQDSLSPTNIDRGVFVKTDSERQRIKTLKKQVLNRKPANKIIFQF